VRGDVPVADPRADDVRIVDGYAGSKKGAPGWVE
jgi:hypothetical protein